MINGTFFADCQQHMTCAHDASSKDAQEHALLVVNVLALLYLSFIIWNPVELTSAEQLPSETNADVMMPWLLQGHLTVGK